MVNRGKALFLILLFILPLFSFLNVTPVYATTVVLNPDSDDYDGYIKTNDATGAACPTGSYTQNTTGAYQLLVIITGASQTYCSRGWLDFNITSIPDTAIITGVNLTLTSFDNTNDPTVDIVGMNGEGMGRPSGLTGAQGWANIGTPSSTYLTNASASVGAHVYELGAYAIIELQAQLDANWFGVGLKLWNETRMASSTKQAEFRDYTHASKATLTVIYTTGYAPTLFLNIAPSLSYSTQDSISFSGIFTTGGSCTTSTRDVYVVIQGNRTGSWLSSWLGLIGKTTSDCEYSFTELSGILSEFTDGSYFFRAYATDTYSQTVYSSIVKLTVAYTNATAAISVSLSLVNAYVSTLGQKVTATGSVYFYGAITNETEGRHIELQSNNILYTGHTSGSWYTVDYKTIQNYKYTFTIGTMFVNGTSLPDGYYAFRAVDVATGTASSVKSLLINLVTTTTATFPTTGGGVKDYFGFIGNTLGIGPLGGGLIGVFLFIGALGVVVARSRIPINAIVLIIGIGTLAILGVMALIITEMVWLLILGILVVVLAFSMKLRDALTGGGSGES